MAVNKRLVAGIAGIFFISVICRMVYAGSEGLSSKEYNGGQGQEAFFGVLAFLHWDHPWNNFKYHRAWQLRRAARLMKKAGIGFVRVDFLWQDIEPSPGKFNFDKYDRFVDILCGENISILGVLGYSADWASDCRQWNCPPRQTADFVKYAEAVIARYKQRIKYWEVWNEPDSGVYWKPQDGMKSYCALLRRVYAAAKKTDPDCKILNGGLAGGISSLNRFYDNGIKDCFDILNLHIFGSPLNLGAEHRIAAFPKLAYKIMKRNGDGKKDIWITEVGCPGVSERTRTDNWWMGANPDEKQQAEWVEKVYGVLSKDKQVKKVFWAFFRDCDRHWNNGVDYFGLVRWDFSLKPAFFAYQKCFWQWRKNNRDNRRYNQDQTQ